MEVGLRTAELPQWERVTWVETKATQPPNYNPSWTGWVEREHDTLNELKEKINVFEVDGTWEQRKKIANPYEIVYTHEEKNNSFCLSKIHPLSRSYFKMIEMLHITQFFKRFSKIKTFYSAHVCEGPGGFIQAFVERAKGEGKRVGTALAMSLRPTNQSIPGWKRAVPFLRKNTEVKICYGEDNTGDIYVAENQAFFARAIGTKVHLFTADGGFDFKTDFLKQEQSVFRLIVASFAMGFLTLGPGGVLIIKLFDTFSRPQTELIDYVSRFFKEWTLYKPAMSRPCNSERYFIGIGFREGLASIAHPFFTALQKDLAERDIASFGSLFSIDQNPECLHTIQTFQEVLEKIQIQTINQAITFDLNNTTDTLRNSFVKSEEWCKAFSIPYKENLFY